MSVRSVMVALICVLVDRVCPAQGTVNFSTRITGVVDAKVFVGSDWWSAAPAGPPFVGQLYAGGSVAELRPIGQPIPFPDTQNAARGYIRDELVVVPGFPGGASVLMQMRAWSSAYGVTFEDASRAANGLYAGESNVFEVMLGSDVDTPSYLRALNGFLVVIPEPASTWLLILGGGLLCRRCRTM